MTDNRYPNTELRILDDCRLLFVMIQKFIENYKNDCIYYSLNQHIIRTVVSVGSNIAEGSKKDSKEFRRFLMISRGSLAELEFQLSLYPKYVNESDIGDVIDKIKAVVYKLNKRSSENG